MNSTKFSFFASQINGSACRPSMKLSFLRAAALVAAIGASGCVGVADDTEELTDNQDENSAEISDEVSAATWHADLGLIGGSGGAYTKTPNFNAGPIKTIEVWAGGSSLRGIRITHWNGEKYQAGSLTDRYSSFTFQSGEKVTALSMWGNGAGTRSGGFKMKTSKGREFFPHMYDWGLKTEYPMAVGSGFLVGYQARYGNDIDALGFVLVNDVSRVAVTNMSYYGKANGESAGQGQPLVLGSANIDNRNSIKSASYTLSATQTTTSSNSFTNEFGVEVGAEFGFEGGVPFVAAASSTFSLKLSTKYSATHETSTAIGVGWSVTKECPARYRCSGSASVTQWSKDLPYSGTMKYYLKNGLTYTHPTRGNYHGVFNTQLAAKFSETK